MIGAVGVSIDITELKRTQRQLFEAAHRDRLTGLPNRYSLEQRLQEAIGEARRDGSRFALVFLDLDRFKSINDTLGHGAGDDVLREVARACRAPCAAATSSPARAATSSWSCCRGSATRPRSRPPRGA